MLLCQSSISSSLTSVTYHGAPRLRRLPMALSQGERETQCVAQKSAFVARTKALRSPSPSRLPGGSATERSSGSGDSTRLALPSQSHQSGKRRAIADRHLGQHLPIDLDAGGLQAGHEPTVAQPVLARRRVDADDPQAVEVP